MNDPVNLKKHLDLLGLRARDRITKFEGVVASVLFDLYGCIQVVITPEVESDGKLKDSHYFDVSRLEVLGKKPVMARPVFEWTPETISEGGHGPAERPREQRR